MNKINFYTENMIDKIKNVDNKTAILENLELMKLSLKMAMFDLRFKKYNNAYNTIQQVYKSL